MVTLSRFPCPKDRSWDFFVSVGQIHGRTMCFPLRHRWFYYILLVSQTIIFFPKCVVRWDWVYWKARRTGTWTWCCLEIEAKIKKKNTPSKRNSSLLKRDRAPKPKSNFFKHFLFSGAVQIFRAIFFCSILVFKGARFLWKRLLRCTSASRVDGLECGSQRFHAKDHWLFGALAGHAFICFDDRRIGVFCSPRTGKFPCCVYSPSMFFPYTYPPEFSPLEQLPSVPKGKGPSSNSIFKKTWCENSGV